MLPNPAVALEIEARFISEFRDISTKSTGLSPKIEIYRRNLQVYLRKLEYIDGTCRFISVVEIYTNSI
ncbi:hypothetical protein UP17_19190 [Peribacillus simplex]|nr:hypothetical protein UP17_19190 [Peribacillus simplex]